MTADCAEGKTDQARIFFFFLMNNQLLVPHAGLAWVEDKAAFTPESQHALYSTAALYCTAALLFSLLPKAVPCFHKFLLQCFVKDEDMLLQHKLHHSASILHRLFHAFPFLLHSVAEGRLPSHFKAMMFSSNCTGKNKKGLWGTRI